MSPIRSMGCITSLLGSPADNMAERFCPGMFPSTPFENDSTGQWVVSTHFQHGTVIKCQTLTLFLYIIQLQRFPGSKNKINSPEFMYLGHVLSIQQSFMKCVSKGGHQTVFAIIIFLFKLFQSHPRKCSFMIKANHLLEKMHYFQLTLLLASAKCI